MIIGHVPGRCSTSFTNNLEHVTTFSKLDSFYRLDLNLPKKGINKICSHSRGSDFTLLLSLSRLKQIYQCLFCVFNEDLKDGHERRFFLPPVSTRLQHTHCGATTRLSVALL